jgi:glycosyltransferase involved in cell wall biosynthesis
MVTLANHLDRDRFTPILALGLLEGPYLKDLANDVTIYHLGGAWRARQAILAVFKGVWSLRPHVILSTLGLNLAVALARPLFPLGTRVVLRAGTTISAYLQTSSSNARLRTLDYKWIYRLADVVICQSDYMLNDMAINFSFPRKKLVRIYNPVDIDRVRTLATLSGAPFEGTGPRLLAIGNLYPAKGFDVLLEAFKAIHLKHPKATLTILGEGEDMARLKHLAKDLGIIDAVRFPGFQSNPYTYLKHANLLVSPSRYEGLSNVILEALALGTPVVATDCPGGNREVVKEGVNGWLAKVDDPESLAQALLRALKERLTLDANVIRAQCEAKFSVDHIVSLYQSQF